MSQVAAHIRHFQQIEKAYSEAKEQYERINTCQIKLNDPGELVTYFQNRQLSLVQLAVLRSLISYLQAGGGSRGSYLVLSEDGQPISQRLDKNWLFEPELEELRKFSLEYEYVNNEHCTQLVPVREIPKDQFWYEKVWTEFLNGEYF
jgi:hypothetical protein